MKIQSTTNSNKDSQKLILEIRNKLRTLGLKPSIKGTILINKAIRIILETVDYEDYFMANEIYKKVNYRFFGGDEYLVRITDKCFSGCSRTDK